MDARDIAQQAIGVAQNAISMTEHFVRAVQNAEGTLSGQCDTMEDLLRRLIDPSPVTAEERASLEEVLTGALPKRRGDIATVGAIAEHGVTALATARALVEHLERELAR